MFRITLSLIDRQSKTKDGYIINQFLKEVIDYLPQLQNWISTDSSNNNNNNNNTTTNSTQSQRVSALELISKLLPLNSHMILSSPQGLSFVRQAFVCFMARSIPLQFKIQALKTLTPYLLKYDPQLVRDNFLSNIILYEIKQ